jgi:hypothetical protein
MTNLLNNARRRFDRMAAYHAQWLADGAPRPQWLADMDAYPADPQRPVSDLARHAMERKARMVARAAATAAAE